MTLRTPAFLTLRFAQDEEFGPLEEIEVRYVSGPLRRKSRRRHWKSNARTDVLAAALALLCLRGREGATSPVLDSSNGEGEASLCARIHDLWHSPRKRVESHWLDAVFDEGTRELSSPLALILTRSGGRKSAAVRFAEGFGPANVSFHLGERICRASQLWAFLEKRFRISRPLEDSRPGLPSYRTSLVGREADLEEVTHLIKSERVVTLFGPSGVGKTRLAVEVGKQARHFVDGVHLIDLSSARTEAQVVQRVLERLPQSGDDSRSTLLADRVRDLEALLILDNCETVLAEVAQIVQTMVEVSERSVVLATTIEPLGVHAERSHRVLPLAVPSREASQGEMLESASVQLFLERSRAAGVSIEESGGDLRSVLEICRAVSGLPLGIELAASGVHRFPIGDLAVLLLKHLDLVKSVDRSAPARHESLQTVVEWTWGLLSEDEQQIFVCLSFFPLNWSLEAAMSVCELTGIDESRVLRGHGRLVDLSIVRIGSDQRFAMLDPLRSFAAERGVACGGDDSIALAFEQTFLSLAESVGGPHDNNESLTELTAETANFHCAASSALEHGRVETAIRFVEALYPHWLAAGTWVSGREICLRILETKSLAGEVEFRVLRAVAGLEFRLGSIAAARKHYERVQNIATTMKDSGMRAHALHGLGAIAFRTDHLAEAEAYFEKAAEIWSDPEDRKNLLNVLNNLAAIAATEGRFEQAAERFGQVVEMATQSSDRRTLANSLMNFGLMSWRMGDSDGGQKYFRRSLLIFEELDDPWGEANVCNNLAVLTLSSGDLEQSSIYHARSLEIRARVQDMAGIVASLEGFASLALAQGDPGRAIRLIAAARTLRTEHELQLTEENRSAVERDWAQSKAQFSSMELAVEERLGGTLSWREAVSIALLGEEQG